MSIKKKIIILISGTGSNMQAIINANINHSEIIAIISNNPKAKGIEWAFQQGLTTHVLNHQLFKHRDDYDKALIHLIEPYQPDLIVLAGFMRILTTHFCQRFNGKIMNIHPSLLPAFPGLHTHQQAINYGCKIAGCTVHFVTPKLDEGPIIAQAAVTINPEDTAESLAAKVLECEHIIYPKAVADYACGNLILEGHRVINHQLPSNDQVSQKIIRF